MSRKSVLVSAYFAKNVGDDLFLKVLFDRYPHVDWYLLTAKKEYETIFKSYPHVNTINLHRNIAHINLFICLAKLTHHMKKYDAFVMIGGSIFMQNEAWEKTYLLRTQLLTLLKKYHIPTYIIGANFGPYDDEYFLQTYYSHFKNYTGICFRDLYSYDLFDDLHNVKVAPDAVLTLNVKKLTRKMDCIGFAPIYLKNRNSLRQYTNSYYEKHKQLIDYYIKREYTVKLFSFCQYEGDLHSINKIIDLLPIEYKAKIDIVSYEGDLVNFLREFQTCSTIIGTRFHSLILAMKFNQQFLPIIYSAKTVNNLNMINLKHTGYYIENLDQLNINEIKYNDVVDASLFKQAEQQFAQLDKTLFTE